ncbi:MAG TPA: chemotaxis protein CheX [Gemmatimonadaceae bacterium]|nr:chemotaxis protein CheX [Gemmatimonadaceae bacterium]
MTSSALRTALSSATISTFEELGLLFPADGAAPARRGEPLVGGVRVDFDGPWRGTVVVRATAGVLATAAANMLGRAEPPAEPLRRDALGELANVLCGNLLPAVAGRAAVFELGAPRWLSAGDAVGRDVTGDEAPAAALALELEEGRVEVTLHVTHAPVERAEAP